jgi:hypothetical protein
VTALLQARLQILALLGPLEGLQSISGCTLAIGLGVKVRNLNIEDTISSALKEAADEDITTGILDNWFIHTGLAANRIDTGFFADRRGGEGLGCKGCELIA